MPKPGFLFFAGLHPRRHQRRIVFVDCHVYPPPALDLINPFGVIFIVRVSRCQHDVIEHQQRPPVHRRAEHVLEQVVPHAVQHHVDRERAAPFVHLGDVLISFFRVVAVAAASLFIDFLHTFFVEGV